MWTKLKVLAFGLAAFGLALGGLAIASQLSLAQAAPMEPDLGKKDVIPRAKVIVSSPKAKDVVITEQFVCNIRAQRHIEVCARANGLIEEIFVKEGQAVKKGDVMFKTLATLYEAKLRAELAEVQIAELEYDSTKKLFEEKRPVLSRQQVLLDKARLDRAKATAIIAEAELSLTTVRAPFDGLIGRLKKQQGSVIKDGDTFTTLSDNRLMWVYFNMPEVRYLQLMACLENKPRADKDNQASTVQALLAEFNRQEQIELVLADGSKFAQIGKLSAIEGDFNVTNGNMSCRADFPNPDYLLRHGQTGTVLMHRKLNKAVVIPQRATFEILGNRFVYVVDKDNVAHLREIVVGHELDGVFVIKKGLDADDKIIVDGLRKVRDGAKVEFEFRIYD